MSTHPHRPQKQEQIYLTDTQPVRVTRIRADDRMHNPRDLAPDERAIDNGAEHGGVQESRAEALSPRGSGGRKRSRMVGRHHVGRVVSNRR